MRNSIFAKGDREYLFDSLHIFVLSGFAVTQPLFDLLSRNAEFFVVRRSEPVDIILLVYFVCIVIPALVVAVEMAVGLWSRRVREKLHGVVVASLVAVIALPALNRLDGFPGTALLISAAILGVGMSICYVRFRPAQMFLTVLSPALLIFPSLFLFNSPVSKLVFSGDDSESLRSNVNGASPVVIVVFDELAVTSLMDENRQIDPIRYPNFAALAREATWFRNATTVADNTVYGVPAILTGNYPDFALLPTAADHPNNLFTLLGGFYEMKVFESHTMICAELICKRDEYQRTLRQRIHFILADLSVAYLHIILPPDMTTWLPVTVAMAESR